ncbi:MAG: glycosyltransferase family 39 protein [Anaerolineae bacterium]|nr:glycosyltransferase family 39 protein [Anaerolineae bacterium]
MTSGADKYEKLHRFLLAGLVVLYLALGISMSIVIPLGESPDEPAHFFYIQYVAQNGQLPVMQPRLEDNVTGEGFQAPAYYSLAALMVRPFVNGKVSLFANPAFQFGLEAPIFFPLAEHRFPWQGDYLAWHLVRFFSLALGLVSLWAAYRAGLLVFGSRWSALATAAFLTLNPQFIYLHSMVTNDVLAVTAGSLMTLVALHVLRAPSVRYYIFGACVIGLAALAKPSALTLLPGIGLALILGWRALPSARVRWFALGCVGAISLLGSGWWYVRNLRLYGDLFGLSVAKQALAPNYYATRLTLIELLGLAPQMLLQTFKTSWGYFGWIAFPLPDVVYWIIAALHVPALVGLLLGFRKANGRLRAPIVLGAAWLGLLAGFFYYNLETNSSGWQGRFLLPGQSLVAIGFVAGLRYWFKHKEVLLAGCTLSAGAFLVVYALFAVVLPSYRPPSFLPEDISVPHAEVQYTAADVMLVGYELEQERVVPGSDVKLTLYWKARQMHQTPYLFSVDSYTQLGEVVINRTESRLAQTYPTILWPVGQVVADRYLLQVNDGIAQAAVSLGVQVAFEENSVLRSVSFADRGGQPVGERLEIGLLVVSDRIKAYDLQHVTEACFGEVACLQGYDFPTTTVRAGDILTATLYWEVLTNPKLNYQVFVHLLDGSGQLVTQHDGPPRMGRFPTSVWIKGDRIVDQHPIQIPDDYTGTLQPCVGFYRLDTFERLPVSVADVGGCPDGAFPLVQLSVTH